MPRRRCRCRSTRATGTMPWAWPGSCRAVGTRRSRSRACPCHELRAVLNARAQLVKIKRDLENQARGSARRTSVWSSARRAALSSAAGPACYSPGCRSGASSKPGVTGCGNAWASRRPRSPWPENLRFERLTRRHWRHGPLSPCTACGVMEPTSSGQPRRLRLRSNNLQEFRQSGTDVPVGVRCDRPSSGRA